MSEGGAPARGPDRLLAGDFDLSLLVFTVVSTLAAWHVRGKIWLEGPFNPDCYMATAWARHILFSREDPWRLHDINTHGFVHPLLYLPILAVMEWLGVPRPAQDNLAIAFVYVLTLGLIGVLSYVCGRRHLRQPGAFLTVIVALSTLLLDGGMDGTSPNAEMLGAVLLLSLWAVLIHGPRIRFWKPTAIVIGVFIVHLKYQLIPQLCAFVVFGLTGHAEAVWLLISIGVAALGTDLAVYRLNGNGILGRFRSLAVDYVVGEGGRYASPVITASQYLQQIASQCPQILIAWLAWLNPAARPGKERSWVRDLAASLVLTAITLVAIVLPGKGYDHYYLLFIPTSVFVMTMALRHSRLARE